MSKDVVFVYPKPGIDFSPALPFPILFPASTLIDAGFSVEIVDERILEKKEFIAKLKKHAHKSPIFFGISTMTGPQIGRALNAAEIIRNENENIPIVWGGVHSTLLPEQALQDKRVDIVIRGEGEATVVELAQKLENNEKLDSVDGISYKNDGKIKNNKDRPFIDINKLPPLPYQLLDLKKYLQKTSMGDTLQMYTSRGCPFNCKFCYNNFYNKRTWRSWNAERTIAEFKTLMEKINFNAVFFLDDNFFTNLKRIEELMNLLKKENIKINWSADCRFDCFMNMSDEFLNKLIDGGLRKLYIGAEAGSERVLKLINKGVTPQQIIEANKRLAKFNITPEISFILGFPTETIDEIKETMNVIDRIISDNKKAIIALVKCFQPFPGTEMFDLAVKNGFEPPKYLEDWSTFNYYTSHMPWFKGNVKEIETVSLISRFVTRMFVQYGIRNIFMKAYNPIARFRWNHRIFTPSLDTMILNYIRSRELNA
jgi:radical SAM superfamily enzyme YgiQ (UPF0313 family)